MTTNGIDQCSNPNLDSLSPGTGSHWLLLTTARHSRCERTSGQRFTGCKHSNYYTSVRVHGSIEPCTCRMSVYKYASVDAVHLTKIIWSEILSGIKLPTHLEGVAVCAAISEPCTTSACQWHASQRACDQCLHMLRLNRATVMRAPSWAGKSLFIKKIKQRFPSMHDKCHFYYHTLTLFALKSLDQKAICTTNQLIFLIYINYYFTNVCYFFSLNKL